jgi:hypothetical protein
MHRRYITISEPETVQLVPAGRTKKRQDITTGFEAERPVQVYIDRTCISVLNLDPDPSVWQPEVGEVTTRGKLKSLRFIFVSPAKTAKHHGIAGFPTRTEVPRNGFELLVYTWGKEFLWQVIVPPDVDLGSESRPDAVC